MTIHKQSQQHAFSATGSQKRGRVTLPRELRGFMGEGHIWVGLWRMNRSLLNRWGERGNIMGKGYRVTPLAIQEAIHLPWQSWVDEAEVKGKGPVKRFGFILQVTGKHEGRQHQTGTFKNSLWLWSTPSFDANLLSDKSLPCSWLLK